jgi:hypothetical protein
MASPGLRLKNLAVGGVAFLLTEAGREVDRPWVHGKVIDDWGIADTLGNSLGTLAAAFVISGLVGKDNSSDYRLIAMVAVGLAIHELLQGPMGGTIDPNDIVASLLFGVASGLVYRVLNRHPMVWRAA